MLIEQLIKLRKVKNEKIEIEDRSSSILRDRVMDGVSVNDYFQLQIAQNVFESKLEACPVKEVLCLCFKHSIFTCYRFGCKVWLLLIQNRARICFQAFARHHLKLRSEQSHTQQTPYPWRGRRFRSAAWHRIRFGTC